MVRNGDERSEPKSLAGKDYDKLLKKDPLPDEPSEQRLIFEIIYELLALFFRPERVCANSYIFLQL